MLAQRLSTPPTGPRASRTGRNKSTVLASVNGGIQKRRAGPLRVDKEGDVEMGTAGAGRGEGGRTGRGRGLASNGNPFKPGAGTRDGVKIRGRATLNPAAIQKAIGRGISSGDAIFSGGRGAFRGGRRNEIDVEGLDKLSVTGWKESKATSNQGGGIAELKEFLERKASTRRDVQPGEATGEPVRIVKSRVQGDALIIFVKPADTNAIRKLQGFSFVGATLHIEQLTPSTAPGAPADAPVSPNTDLTRSEIMEKTKAMLARRYNPEEKLLDLSALASDPEFANTGTFAISRQSKFFIVIMKVCEDIFPTAAAKREAVSSVILSNNNLEDLHLVTTLAVTFRELKNLDLSNNQFRDIDSLKLWRWKFRYLDHLILTNNPVETLTPEYKQEIIRWYPSLRTLNGERVRSDEDAENAIKGKLPLPVAASNFQDEASIGETFIKQFFPAYDGDRTALVNGFYDNDSTFSLNVDTSRAPNDPDAKTAWGIYISKSRNLARITHLTSIMNRAYKGVDKIREFWSELPRTHHPDLMSEPQKWCIECHPMPGLPDITDQSPGGVGGLLIMVHGEFTESDTNITRSFSRTIVLGPGSGAGGLRVVNDLLSVRAYGGHAAWVPEEIASPIIGPASTPLTQTPSAEPPVPEGWGQLVGGKSEEQVQKELLALELSKVTRMTLTYSGMCLEQSEWNLEMAVKTFEGAKATLPAEAFV